jgi:hypothetical protein
VRGGAVLRDDALDFRERVVDAEVVLSEFRAAALAHAASARSCLERVKRSLAATPSEAAAALKEDGTFLATGSALPSRMMPAPPKLRTLELRARVGDAKTRRRREAGSAAVSVSSKPSSSLKKPSSSRTLDSKSKETVTAKSVSATEKIQSRKRVSRLDSRSNSVVPAVAARPPAAAAGFSGDRFGKRSARGNE